MKEAKALRGTDWWLQESRGDVKDSIGNIVNDSLSGPAWLSGLINPT